MNETLKLRRRVAKAEQARDEMEQYKPYLAKRQQQYLSELLLNYRSGEPTERALAKLVALDDVVNDLSQDIQTGVTAAKKLSEIALQKEAQDG